MPLAIIEFLLDIEIGTALTWQEDFFYLISAYLVKKYHSSSYGFFHLLMAFLWLFVGFSFQETSIAILVSVNAITGIAVPLAKSLAADSS
jgi:hypothetical protein